MMTNKVEIGKTLDANGEPVEGSGIELQVEGPTVKVLKDSVIPLVTNPVTGEYLAVLADPNDNDGEDAKALVIMPKGASGPPEHYHPHYLEEFEVVEGEFIFVHQGKKLP